MKGNLKFIPGFNIIFLGSPNCKTIAWLTSFTIKIEKKAVNSKNNIIGKVNFYILISFLFKLW